MSVAALSAAALLTACDPLLTAQDRGDPVFEVRALVQTADGKPVRGDYQLGLLYLRSTTGMSELGYATDVLDIKLEQAGSIGAPPARLALDLAEVPPAEPWRGPVFHTTDDQVAGNAFSSEHHPDGVWIGQVVIGPRDELAALPARIEVPLSVSTDTVAFALGPYLPTTTISGYQLVYAEGVGPDDLLYPAYVGLPRMPLDGIPIADGFTLVDMRAYAEAVAWRACLFGVGYPQLDLTVLQACEDENRERIDCLDRCARPSCQQACAAAFPDQLDTDACFTRAELPLTADLCGPARLPLPYLLRVVSPEDELSITLGVDDVRDGLWPPQ